MIHAVLVEVVALAGGLVVLLWVALLVRTARLARRLVVLDAQSHGGPLTDAPAISVIVAGKDEAARIETCIETLLAQDYPQLEVIFVDDRSCDDTPAILARLAQAHAGRLKTIRVDALPDGWGGQNHAIQRGVQASSGRWLCFTDADCELLSPRALSIAYAEAKAHGAPFLSMLPKLSVPSLWEQFYLPLFSFVHAMRLRILEVNDRRTPAGYANGAFMLIERGCYEALGGHEAVRSFINDDTRLGRMAKLSGRKLRLVGSADLLRTRMYATPRAAWRGWTRNTYSSMQEGHSLTLTTLALLVLLLLPWPCLLASASLQDAMGSMAMPAVIAWGAAVLISHAGAAGIYAAMDFRARWSWLYYPSALFAFAVLAHSMFRASRRSGLTWHGVRYPHPPPHD